MDRHRILVGVSIAALLLATSCGKRATQGEDPAPTGPTPPGPGAKTTAPDNRPFVPTDSGPPTVDASATCGASPLGMGFVFAEEGGPNDPAASIELNGVVVYHGPITEPLASAPMFNREVRIDDPIADGHTLVIQYYLPGGRELPVQVKRQYTFIVKRRQTWEAVLSGLIIRRNTSGLWPLIFVGEPAAYGQTFDLDDPLFAPIEVTRIEQQQCEGDAPLCGDKTLVDRLRFSASTGAGINQIELAQGQTGVLSVFGNDFNVANVLSQQVVNPCPDLPSYRAAYMLSLRAQR